MNRSISRAAALVIAATLGASAQTAWKAGVASVDITPREPIWMAGYAARTKPSAGVLHPIYAKALALQDETGKTLVLVTADLSGFPRELADAVAKQCQANYNLTRDRLLLNASHNHSGPVTLPYLQTRPGYRVGDAQEQVVRRYTEGLQGSLIALVGRALGDLKPAMLAFEQSLAGIAVNRRRASISRKLPGVVDPDVPVLSVLGTDGKLRAIVAGYACHATVLSDYQINGDWPGFAQTEIEKRHPGATALFVQGCGADANLLPRRTVEPAGTAKLWPTPLIKS